jgi:uncharacterized membrane protein YfcA
MFSTVLFLIVALISEILGTVGGFGSSAIFVPLAGFFYGLQTVLAITSVLHVFSNAAKLLLFRKTINYKIVLWIGIPSVIMVIVGAQLNSVIDLTYAELILGIFLVLFSCFLFFYPHYKLAPSNKNAVASGSLAGFFAGLIGTGGAIRAMGLAAFDLEKSTFVATSAAVDLGVDLSRAVVYIYNGYLRPEFYFYIPLLLAIAVAGSWMGKRILEKVSQENFRKIVLVLLFLIGITQIVKTFL